MTYAEIIDRAATAAFQMRPDMPLARLRVAAEAEFSSIEEDMAVEIATNPEHPMRANIADVTSALTSGALIPSTGSGTGRQIIGEYGIVRDGSDSKSLSKSFSLEAIRRLGENVNTWRKIPVYSYVIVKPRIFHTRTTVIIDVCVWDVAAQETAIAADTVIFPKLGPAYISALVDRLRKIDGRDVLGGAERSRENDIRRDN